MIFIVWDVLREAVGLVWLLTAMGGLLVGLSLKVLGVPGEIAAVVNNIHLRRGRIDVRQTPSMIVASLLSISFGSMYLTKEPRSGSKPTGASLFDVSSTPFAAPVLQCFYPPPQLGNLSPRFFWDIAPVVLGPLGYLSAHLGRQARALLTGP